MTIPGSGSEVVGDGRLAECTAAMFDAARSIAARNLRVGPIERSTTIGARHLERRQPDAVESLGEAEERRVAVAPNFGDDRCRGVANRVVARRRTVEQRASIGRRQIGEFARETQSE